MPKPPVDEDGAPSRRSPPSRSLFAVPAPIKQLFDVFPLHSYLSDDLPQRSPRTSGKHALYSFTTVREAAKGSPSFNPGCLKWQTYLKFSGIDFTIVPSSNHASPTGTLPFLLPTLSQHIKIPKPIASGKLQRWAMTNSSSAIEEPEDLRYEAYMTLLDHRIRRAWLCSVYLSPNFASIAEPLYVLSASTNPIVRITIARELEHAAEKELLKFSTVIDVQGIHALATEAFAVLEMALADQQWFFGAKKPGLFDAHVFSYTHLLMDETLGRGWIDAQLRAAVLTRKNLVAHRNRILSSYYPD